MSFYTDASEPFLLESAKSYFLSNGIETIDYRNANLFNIDEVFDSVKIGKNYLALPKKAMVNVPVPYDPLCHDEYAIGGNSIEYIIEKHVNLFFRGKKFIFSGRPDIFLAIVFDTFSYQILSEIHSGHLTTPMIMTDTSKKRLMFFEYDLEINTYSRDLSVDRETLGGITDTEWLSYFNENYIKSISYNENHIDIINRYYAKIIDGIKISR